MAIRGLIFDLDGTLVDSGLDFPRMRREMGLAPGLSILEALDSATEAQAGAWQAILERHEEEGARRATAMPGARELLDTLARASVFRAVVTRNRSSIVDEVLGRLGMQVEIVRARDNSPAKPDPTAILEICADWGIEPRQCAMIGDYRFDIEAGRRAGAWTVFFARGRKPAELGYGEDADFVLDSFREANALLAWMRQPT